MFVTDKDGTLIVDFFGKYERLHEDFLGVCDELNISVSLPHINPSPHRDYRSYYNDQTKQIVEDYFGEDIEFLDILSMD